VVLEVHNHSVFDVAVYAIRAPGSVHMRLGTAPSFIRSTLVIPREVRRADGSLVVELHAIGSNRTWTSPEVAIYEGVTACLDVYSDLSGDLSRSSLYTRLTSDSIGTAAPARCGAVVAEGAAQSRDTRTEAPARTR
jgi:hypothetical protein